MSVARIGRWVRLAALSALIGAGLSAGARAQTTIESREGIALQNQLLQLQQQVQAMQQKLSGVGGSSLGGANLGGGTRSQPPAAASKGAADLLPTLLDRESALEDSVRQLRGQVDELSNQLKKQNDDLTKQIGDLGFRVQTLEGGKPATGAATAPTAAAAAPATGTLGTLPAGKEPVPPRPVVQTPEMVLQQGEVALGKRDYLGAEAAARKVLAVKPAVHAADAHFLLARALSGERDFQGAALAFDDTYKRAPTGPHAQDSLLGMAASFNNLSAKSAACATLDKLRAEFPHRSTEVKQAAAALRQRAGCR